jgi:nucleotide sugar dehydrogenase
MTEKDGVCIVGLGFVGLTLAVVMAEAGHSVIGVEINRDTVQKLRTGETHFFEAGLALRLNRAMLSQKLKITDDINESLGVGYFIITVGTPLDTMGNPRSDMVKRAAQEVSSVITDDAVVILRSTVRLGTTRGVILPILESAAVRFHLAFCPERTIEGNALTELRSLPQICGGVNPDDAWHAAQLFQSITPTTIRVSSLEAAELVKLLDNSYRDLTFALGNEVAVMCEAVGLDSKEVIDAGNLGYPRTNIARPGLVGGPCLEKDPHILIHGLADFNFEPTLIAAGRKLNEDLPRIAISKVMPLVSKKKNIKVALCGMAFKGIPETDDLRGTPSKLVLNEIMAAFPDAEVVIQDFACTVRDLETAFGYKAVAITEAFDDADLVVIGNNNKRYADIDLDSLLASMSSGGILYDFLECNCC